MHRQSNRWIKYKKMGNRLSLISYHRDFNLDQHFRPIHINCLSNSLYYYSNRSSTVFTPPPPPKAVDWYTMMLNQPQWIQNLLSCIEFGSVADIVNCIANNTHLIAVSDGSVKTPHMTSA